MASDKTPLVWIDMEMSGLVPDRDRILEVAMVVTDAELNTLAEAPVRRFRSRQRLRLLRHLWLSGSERKQPNCVTREIQRTH